MKPHIPEPLLPAVHEALAEGAASALFRCHLKRGTTLYRAEIDRDGAITRVGTRAISAPSDIGFAPDSIARLEPYE